MPAMITGCCWGDATKAEKLQETRRELLPMWQWQKAWCQTGHRKEDSSSNMRCRQAQGSPRKEEKISRELWILFTSPISSKFAWDRDNTQCSLSLLFGSTSSSVALERTSLRVHFTYFVSYSFSVHVLSSSSAGADAGEKRRLRMGAVKQRVMISISFWAFTTQSYTHYFSICSSLYYFLAALAILSWKLCWTISSICSSGVHTMCLKQVCNESPNISPRVMMWEQGGLAYFVEFCKV